MASRNKSRYVMKENRIPIGKKREAIEKKEASLKTDESVRLGSQVHSKLKVSKTDKNLNQVNATKVFNIANINEAPTDTSLSKPIKKQRPKLSTINEIKELEEKAFHSNIKAIMNHSQTTTVNDDVLKEGSTKLMRELQDETKSVEEFNTAIDDTAEVVLSPFVCTTRGKKWRPSAVEPPKLSKLFAKYEDDNMADAYRQKLDEKTVELQNKVKYWTELPSGDDINIPQSIKDEIDVVCGQTKLLTTDKFMQMRTLIEEFDNKSGSMPINLTDLDGFWDMLLLQVEKLENQFKQLEIIKNNNWTAIEPIAKKILINKGLKLSKPPVAKSKLADFIKSQKSKIKKATLNNENAVAKECSESHFNEIKKNSNCLISSTPTSKNQKNCDITPMLLKTMELSYVARRSGMSPLFLAEPQESSLKPALRNTEKEKGIKRKNIQFMSPETNNEFVTPENSFNNDLACKKSCVQNRIVTPHTNKVKAKTVDKKSSDLPNTISVQSVKCVPASLTNVESKKNVPKAKMPAVVDTKMNEIHSVRRSTRLASKPSKNYKV